MSCISLRQKICSPGKHRRRTTIPLLALLFLLLQPQNQCPRLLVPRALAQTVVHQACLPADPAMNGTHEVFRGQDVIWQIPPNPRAILFLAHGGDSDPFTFFDQGPGCPLCYGLPEHRMAVLDALKERYAVLTLKSVKSLWWTAPDIVAGNDIDILVDLVKAWTRRYSLEHLPLVAWGHSAGGRFASTVPLFLPVQSLVMMCAAGETASLEMATAAEYPPTFFAYMNNTDRNRPFNQTTVYEVYDAESLLAARGVPVVEKEVFALPIFPTFFSERVHCIGSEVSQRIYQAFKADGSWLDDRDYLVKDPFVDDWRSVLVTWNAVPFCAEAGDICYSEQVERVLKVAQGIHGFTRDANPEIFAWLNWDRLHSPNDNHSKA